MLVHSLFVESVDLRRLGGSAGGNDLVGDHFDRCQVAPGDKDLGPFARKGACDRTTDRTCASVDHRNLVLQHHRWFLFPLSVDVRTVGAVDEVDTATPGKWAPANRPVRPAAGVCTRWNRD